MKLTNMAILFLLLAIISSVIIDSKINNLAQVQKMKMEYDKRMDSAIDDAAYELVEVDTNRDLVMNKEEAVDQFFHSLYSNLNIIGQSSLENKLGLYIPIIVIVDKDGFYLYYSDINQSEHVNQIQRRWSDKIPYTYEDENLIIRFTLGDYIYLYDTTTNTRREGLYQDLKSLYPNSILNKDTIYDQIRRKTIINLIEAYMIEYINQYNHIAKNFGITYHFSLPQIDKTDWYRTIDDISILVLFQGYPYSTNGLDFYNRYAFSGARITKAKAYYVEENGNDGILYYHKGSCSELHYKQEIYFTKEECAEERAFPCPVCKP